MLSNEKFEECKQLYLSGISLSQICEKIKVNFKTLSNRLKKNNIIIREKFSYNRKLQLNENYFDLIDSEEKAYILGFIYADGNNLYHKNRLSIQVNKKDENILNKISSLIYYDPFVLKYTKRLGKHGQLLEYKTFYVHNNHMSQQLAKLGVVERKSKVIEFPLWLDKNLYKHFIRGLIDGDGWIYLPTNNRYSPNVGLISTTKMNKYLLDFFEKELDIKSYLSKANKQNFDEMCEIRIKNYHRCKIILDWLYKDASIYLDRKYNLYKDFLSIYDNLRNQNK